MKSKITNSIVGFILLTLSSSTIAQMDTCINRTLKYKIISEHLQESREYWVSLPMRFDSSKKYPVIYVLDAEWRFDLIRNLAYDLAGNRKIPHHIIVGIPHIDWEFKRGIDLTFSQSRMEYDGEEVDSTWYNSKNSGGAIKFYQFLQKELIPHVNGNYKTDGNILVGHSYGGYFGMYLLGLEHQFKAMQIYDPSIWYGNGEVLDQIEANYNADDTIHVYIAYQNDPEFHYTKIKDLISLLKNYPTLKLDQKEYNEETHNALYLFAFLDGIRKLYLNFDDGSG